MSEETLHFVEITDQEKRLLNVCRIFMDKYHIEEIISNTIEDVASEMVDHDLDKWTLDEIEDIIKESNDKEISLFPLYLEIREKILGSKKNAVALDEIREQWKKQIIKNVNGNLVNLENITL